MERPYKSRLITQEGFFLRGGWSGVFVPKVPEFPLGVSFGWGSRPLELKPKFPETDGVNLHSGRPTKFS